MLAAAKEEITFPLAASPLTENSHPGHRLSTALLHPGISFLNSNTATRLAASLYDEGRRSRCTGKERDSETGLDYFGARYYGSALGRWTSPDPKAFSKQTLANPQKWNKYAYVLNNPLALFDPDGQEEITVTYRTFIPDQQITFLGQRYDGNNRSFTKSTSANDVFRSKSVASVTVETDPKISANPLVTKQTLGGFAVKRDETGNVTAAQQANSPNVSAARDGNGNVVINIDQDVKNPLSPAWAF